MVYIQGWAMMGHSGLSWVCSQIFEARSRLLEGLAQKIRWTFREPMARGAVAEGRAKYEGSLQQVGIRCALAQ